VVAVPADLDRTRDQLVAALHDISELARNAVPGCAAASVSLLHDGTASSLAATHEQVRRLDEDQYGRDDGPCVTSMREHRVISVENYLIERRWPGVARDIEAAGFRSSLSVPLLDDDRTIGGLNMYGTQVAGFTAASLEAAQVFVRQATLMLRYLMQMHSAVAAQVREHEIAVTLQRSLLPTLPELDGVRTAARYFASQSQAQVGGDWYDAFPLPDGAVGVTVGDVVGHDIAAAAAMGQIRSALRAYAYQDVSPAVLLDRLDRLVQGLGLTSSATLVYGRLTLRHGAADLAYANAGHPPPLVRHPDGSVHLLEAGQSPLIGVMLPCSGPRDGATATIPAGSLLLLYTDGLVESRHRSLDEGLAMLVNAVAALDTNADPDQACDRLVEQLVPADHYDDVAILAVLLR